MKIQKEQMEQQKEQMKEQMRIQAKQHEEELAVQREQMELWPDYWSRFCTFLVANAVPDDRKAQVFLTNQTPAVYKQLANLAAQQNPKTDINSLTMDQIVEFMKEQFDPKLFIVRERFKFWSNMERKPGETLQELAARIRQDAATCDFPSIQDPQDEALRQRFICSVNNEAVLKALFKVKDTELDFAKAVKIAIETEDAAKVAKETVYGSKPRPVNKVKMNNKGGRPKNHQQSNSTTSDSAKCYRKTECCIPTSGKPPVAATSATKRHHQPRWAFPSSKQGMQKAALQRDVTKSTRLQPNVINDPEDYVLAARRLLHRCPCQFPGRRYTAQDVEKITERLSTYDPEKVPESRGFEIKLQLPVVYKKQYTDEDIYGIVKRLSHYDPERCPPESRGQGVVPMVIREPSRQTLGSHVKKCSAGQVQEIVNRLSKYDPWKWPPSSRNPRLIASRLQSESLFGGA
nr:hypothetical protein BaRGS_020675 [Batillaria attramentaria]